MVTKRVLVAGGGGFIGGHLAASLLADGFHVRCVDLKRPEEWHQRYADAENLVLDLRDHPACEQAVEGIDEVFNLACDMGGMGYIEHNKALCMLSVLINANLLRASSAASVVRYFFASTACVYRDDRQNETDVTALDENDVYPAMPEDGYGWEKLFGERLCRHFTEDFGLETRVGRYHNVYGPHGTWDGGREKAPAAISRKLAHAALSGDHVIEVWGDGRQTRSFMYIDDCIRATRALMDSDHREPLNIGSASLVSINDLVDLTAEVAGITVERRHVLDAPQGVRGRNSDNTRFRSRFGWEPDTPLRVGLERTYPWILQQVIASRS